MADSVNVAVVANPGLFVLADGNISYIEKALWKVPSQEMTVRKNSAMPMTTLDAILLTGNIVGKIFSDEESRALNDARKKLGAEFQRNREGYIGHGVTDLAGLVEELMHSSKAMSFDKEIALFKKMIGHKRGQNWQKFGEARDRVKQRYGQLLIAAKKCEQKYSTPIFVAADTFIAEESLPESYWLHWRDFTLQGTRVKAWGNAGAADAIPEYAIGEKQRGRASVDPAAFAADLPPIVIAPKMTQELSARLHATKGRVVVIGQETNYDAPGHVVVRQPAGCVEFLTINGTDGLRVQYRWDLSLAKPAFSRASEVPFKDGAFLLPEGESSKTEVMQRLRDFQEILRMEQEMGKFAHLRAKGINTPKDVLEHVRTLEQQVEPLTQYTFRVAEFIERLAKDNGMQDWYLDKKKALAEAVTRGEKTEHAVELEMLDLLVVALRENFTRREELSAKAQKTNLATIDDLMKKNAALEQQNESLAVLHESAVKERQKEYAAKIADLEQKLKRGAVGTAQAALLQGQIDDIEASLAKARQDQGLWVLDTVKRIYESYARMQVGKQGKENTVNPLVVSFLKRAEQATSPEVWKTVTTYLFPQEGAEFDPALAEHAVDETLAALVREETATIADNLCRTWTMAEQLKAQQGEERRKYAAEVKGLGERAAKAEEELAKAADENSNLTFEHHAEKIARMKAEGENRTLKETLETVNGEYAKLSASLDNTTHLHRKTADEKARLSEEFTLLEARVRSLAAELDKSKEHEKSLEAQKAELEKRFAGQRDYATKTEKDLSAARDETATQKAAYDDKQRAYVELERRAIVLEGDLKYATEQNAILAQNIASAERNYAKLEAEKNVIVEESERRNRLMHEIAYDAESKKKEHETRVTDYETLLAEARGEVHDAEEREAAARDQIKQIIDDNLAVVGKERQNVEAKLTEVAGRERQLALAADGLAVREKQLYATVDEKLRQYKRFIDIGKELVKLNNQKREQAEQENCALRAMLRELKPEAPKPYAGGY